MTRRAYPILGRVNLIFLEVNITPLKPVYLKIRFLEVDLRTSLDQSQDQASGPDPGSDSGSRLRSQIPDISDLRIIRYSQSNGRMN